MARKPPKLTSRDLRDQRRIRAKFRSKRDFDAWVRDVQQLPKREQKTSAWPSKLRRAFGGGLLFRTAWVLRVAKKELGMRPFTALRWCARGDTKRVLGTSANAIAHRLHRELKARSLTDAELDKPVLASGYDPASATFGFSAGKTPDLDAPPPPIYFSRVT